MASQRSPVGCLEGQDFDCIRNPLKDRADPQSRGQVSANARNLPADRGGWLLAGRTLKRDGPNQAQSSTGLDQSLYALVGFCGVRRCLHSPRRHEQRLLRTVWPVDFSMSDTRRCVAHRRGGRERRDPASRRAMPDRSTGESLGGGPCRVKTIIAV